MTGQSELTIRNNPLFEHLSEEVLGMLIQASRIRQFPKNSIIFFQGDMAESAYIVSSGSVDIRLSCSDGRELLINSMRPDDCFGELSLITGQPRSTAAIAHEKSELLVIPRRAFIFAMDNEPELIRRLLEMIANRMNKSSDRESALAFLDAPGRLARTLLRLDHQAHEKGYVTISQAELAQWTGLTRQTVSSILGRWRRAGWLITGRGKILILNRTALREIEQQIEI